MAGKVTELSGIEGLSVQQVLSLQKQYGRNVFRSAAQNRFLHILWDIFREPMFILLMIACSLYFILGNTSEGIMMAVAMAIVTAISLYQEVKSSRALEALKQFAEPKVKVIRDGSEQVINNDELVPGDIMLLEEGMKIPADALILQSNDLSVNESIITGESLPAEKSDRSGQNIIYQGTTINSGKCVARVSATGNNTVLGKIGKAVTGYNPPKTLLQLQINKFVRRLALFGLLAFFVIFLVNYLHYREFATSLLFALTLAMSAVPEEIPVAFSSFMALGAYKMSKLGIISRQPQIIENLGAVTVLCLDKTGTITENKMEVKTIYNYREDMVINMDGKSDAGNREVLFFGVLASESDPFDPMEKAIWDAYRAAGGNGYEKVRMIYEYPLEGRPPMMTHVYRSGDKIIAAAKGGAERIVAACRLDEPVVNRIMQYTRHLASKGYRVLGVASATPPDDKFPETQDDFDWQFEGLLALYDPPKKNITEVLKKIYDAKIDIKLVTGDHPETAMNIAQQVGIIDPLRCRTGDEIMNMEPDELRTTVKVTHVFARMFPDAKVKIMKALQVSGEIVAMTGDGVNDGPALKVSDIGIAMGKKGTEMAQQASDLVITDDNLEKIVTAVGEGRKIFSNLVKAVRYIISIHIPIILTASLPVILNWTYPNIFTPIHVIFLELIMGPTCSIFYEREPVEETIMQTTPRSRRTGLFTKEELLISIVQGLMITAGVLILYYIFMTDGHSIEETRTVVFNTLILSNVFLTFAGRSFTRTIYYTSQYRNNLAPVVLVASIIFLALMYFVPAVRELFQLAPITSFDFWVSFGVAFVSVMWFEVYKMGLRKPL
ncbi:MAG: cation-translocating P-type ATPase [Chitinophagaceae bacterium]|nr:cation-translocating P-type ATPase [Chitinophagaceae bacterium]